MQHLGLFIYSTQTDENLVHLGFSGKYKMQKQAAQCGGHNTNINNMETWNSVQRQQLNLGRLTHSPHSFHYPLGLLLGRAAKYEPCYHGSSDFSWSVNTTFGSFGFCLNSLYFALFQINPNFLPEEEWLPQSSLSPGLMPTIPMLNRAMDCPPVPDSGRNSPNVSLITSAVMQTQFCWKSSWANKTRSVFMPKDHKIFWKRSSLPLINQTFIGCNKLFTSKGEKTYSEELFNNFWNRYSLGSVFILETLEANIFLWRLKRQITVEMYGKPVENVWLYPGSVRTR